MMCTHELSFPDVAVHTQTILPSELGRIRRSKGAPCICSKEARSRFQEQNMSCGVRCFIGPQDMSYVASRQGSRNQLQRLSPDPTDIYLSDTGHPTHASISSSRWTRDLIRHSRPAPVHSLILPGRGLYLCFTDL